MDTQRAQTDQEPKRKRVIRISGDLYKRLTRVTRKNNMTITGAAEAGIKDFVDSLDYSYDTVIYELNNQPSLGLHKDLFSKSFKEADRGTLEAVIKILRKGVVDFYECEVNDFEDMIKKINSYGKGVVPILRVNVRHKPDEETKKRLREFFDKTNNFTIPNDSQMLLDTSFEVGDKNTMKVIIFVLKEEERFGQSLANKREDDIYDTG